jgi:hypothetical protein
VALTFRVDRTVMSVGTLTDAPDDRQYWWSRSPEERLEAVEFLRRMNYGHDAAAGLSRVLEIARRDGS